MQVWKKVSGEEENDEYELDYEVGLAGRLRKVDTEIVNELIGDYERYFASASDE